MVLIISLTSAILNNNTVYSKYIEKLTRACFLQIVLEIMLLPTVELLKYAIIRTWYLTFSTVFQFLIVVVF